LCRFGFPNAVPASPTAVFRGTGKTDPLREPVLRSDCRITDKRFLQFSKQTTRWPFESVSKESPAVKSFTGSIPAFWYSRQKTVGVSAEQFGIIPALIAVAGVSEGAL
jgi:hypothetical protein